MPVMATPRASLATVTSTIIWSLASSNPPGLLKYCALATDRSREYYTPYGIPDVGGRRRAAMRRSQPHTTDRTSGFLKRLVSAFMSVAVLLGSALTVITGVTAATV